MVDFKSAFENISDHDVEVMTKLAAAEAEARQSIEDPSIFFYYVQSAYVNAMALIPPRALHEKTFEDLHEILGKK